MTKATIQKILDDPHSQWEGLWYACASRSGNGFCYADVPHRKGIEYLQLQDGKPVGKPFISKGGKDKHKSGNFLGHIFSV